MWGGTSEGFEPVPQGRGVADTRNSQRSRARSGTGNNRCVNGERLGPPPAWCRAFALICSCLLSVGSHYAGHILGALKSTLIKDLGIDNTSYGILQSAVSLVNTALPLFGGIFIDRFGTGMGSLLPSTLILLGECVTAVSAQWNNFFLMVVGRFIYGAGAGVIVTAQQSIIAHWFSQGTGLGIAIGIQIAMSRLAGWAAAASVVPIQNMTGNYAYAIWVSTAICFLSWLLNVFYVIMLKRIDAKYYVTGGCGARNSLKKRHHRLSPRAIWSRMIRLPSIVWIIMHMALLFGGLMQPFLHLSTNIVEMQYGKSQQSAAWAASFGLILPIIISPLAGLLFDVLGRRSLACVLSGLAMSTCMYLLSIATPESASVDPEVPLVLFSIGYAVFPMSVITSIPILILVRPDLSSAVGTMLGLYKCCMNIGATIMDPILGTVQDHEVGGGYNGVLQAFLSLGLMLLLYSLVFTVFSYSRYKGLVDVSHSSRNACLEKLVVRERKTLKRPNIPRPVSSHSTSNSNIAQQSSLLLPESPLLESEVLSSNESDVSILGLGTSGFDDDNDRLVMRRLSSTNRAEDSSDSDDIALLRDYRREMEIEDAEYGGSPARLVSKRSNSKSETQGEEHMLHNWSRFSFLSSIFMCTCLLFSWAIYIGLGLIEPAVGNH
eukprot:Nk52_evm5s147 gene=Nk52_evmTU5s147